LPSLFDSFEGVAKNDVFGNYRGDMGREKKIQFTPTLGQTLILVFFSLSTNILQKFQVFQIHIFIWMYDHTNVYIIKYLFV